MSRGIIGLLFCGSSSGECVLRAPSDKSGKIDFVIVPKRLLKAEESSKMG